MKTKITELLGVEYPIVGFSHCRDVVAAVSKAGGLGMFGAGSSNSPEQLDLELKWIDEHANGRPYGVDVLMPNSISGGEIEVLETRIPQGHRDFVADLVARFQIPPPTPAMRSSSRRNPNAGSPALSQELIEVALAHNVRLIASALGPPPPDIVAAAHRKGVVVAGLAGQVKHARKQAEAGVDIVVAVGAEGGGHVGTVSTMVLVPGVVDAVAPIPVLAAGGIGNGRGVAAALALGAEGVWTGSVWLTTVESSVDPIVKEKLLRASARDAVVSRWWSGKTLRMLRTPWVDAWEEPGAPAPLPRALQTVLIRDAVLGMQEHRVAEVMTTPAGQIIESITQVRRCRDVVEEMALGFIDSAARLADIVDDRG